MNRLRLLVAKVSFYKYRIEQQPLVFNVSLPVFHATKRKHHAVKDTGVVLDPWFIRNRDLLTYVSQNRSRVSRIGWRDLMFQLDKIRP